MKFELLIFGITAFFIVNTYYDGKYIDMLKTGKKYYKMIGIGFAGLSAYLYLKKNPSNTRSILSHANGIIKHMPIDKDSSDILTPFLDMTSLPGGNTNLETSMGIDRVSPQQKRMLNSGKTSTKRCVSETKKKFVAARQNWCCGKCNKQLPAWYEVDHKVRLEYGGSNHVDNLIALCRDCHGEKTALENL